MTLPRTLKPQAKLMLSVLLTPSLALPALHLSQSPKYPSFPRAPPPRFHVPESRQQKYFRDSKGRPRQDGGALGAQVLGRRLGAPVGAQRVPGGDGEAASRARERERRGGARDARLAGPGPGGWGWFPPRSGPAGRGAARCTARVSLPSNELQPSLWLRRILEEKSWLLRLAPSFLSLAKPSVQWNESPKQ